MGHYGPMRLFAAIALPPPVADHLAHALAMVAPTSRAARNPWLPSLNWHITLGFYGNQPEDIVPELTGHLARIAAQTAPFGLALAGAGVFRHDVCWIGLSDPAGALGALAEGVRGPYAVTDQHARNRFHVTVSRSGRSAGLGPAMMALSVYRGPEWQVGRIGLYRSELGEGIGGHPLYTEVASVGLTGE